MIWTDESKVDLSGQQGFHYVWHKANIEFHRINIVPDVKRSGSSVMVSGCFVALGPGWLLCYVQWYETQMQIHIRMSEKVENGLVILNNLPVCLEWSSSVKKSTQIPPVWWKTAVTVLTVANKHFTIITLHVISTTAVYSMWTKMWLIFHCYWRPCIGERIGVGWHSSQIRDHAIGQMSETKCIKWSHLTNSLDYFLKFHENFIYLNPILYLLTFCFQNC